MRFRSSLPFLSAGLVLVWGCDTAPGPAGDQNAAPRLSNLNFSPSSVLLDDLPSGTVQGGIARFSLTVQVDVSDADNDLDRVFVLVQPPVTAAEPTAVGEVEAPGNGRLSLDLPLEIPLAETGVYSVEVFAADRSGALGNKVVGTLIVDAASEPPVIEEVEIPDRVTRPAPGEAPVQIPIVARVTDPDGQANILRVEVVINGSSTFSLCDDGGGGSCNPGFPDSGDAVAGDGQYTLTILLDASNAPGENEFVFTAIDRAGLASESVTRVIVVE